MSYFADPNFEKKLRRVVKRHNRLATSGTVHKMQSDGLVVAKARGFAPRFPWVGLVTLIAAVLIFKGYVHYALGAEEFAARAAALEGGSLFEQLGAMAMSADAITLTISNLFTTLMG